MCPTATATALVRHTGLGTLVERLLVKPSSASGQQQTEISVRAPAACALRCTCVGHVLVPQQVRDMRVVFDTFLPNALQVMEARN